MFKVLYAPYKGVDFWRFQPEKGTPAVLAWVRPSSARVYICAEKGKEEMEIPMIEAAAGFLNDSPSIEFAKLMLRSIKDESLANANVDLSKRLTEM